MESKVIAMSKHDISEDMVDHWRQLIGAPTPQVRNLIAYWLQQDGITDFDVMYAIDETSVAASPSVRYMVAILRRIQRERKESHV